MRDTIDGLVVHLGGNVSETQRMACRRIAVLETEMVFMEDQIGLMRQNGKEPDPALLDLYCRLGNAQRRFCEHLGWHSVPKEVVPSLASYVAATTASTDET
jgi:hypothetical protein